MEKNTVKRITKAMRFEDIIALLIGGEVKYGTDVNEAVTFIKNEMALLAKKNSSDSKKLTSTQKDNERLKELILEFLYTQSEPLACGDIAKNIPELAIFQNQKTASLLRQLILAEKVSKTMVKGQSLFAIRL